MRIGSFGIRAKITLVIVIAWSLGLVLAAVIWIALGSIRGDLDQADDLENLSEKAISMDVAADTLTTCWSGYVLTGDSRFLEQYRHGVQGILKAFEELRPKLAQGSKIVETLDGAELAFNSWRTSVGDPGIMSRQEHSQLKGADASVSRAIGADHFGKFKERTTAFRQEAKALLKGRVRSANDTTGFIRRAVEVGMPIIIVVGTLIAQVIGKGLTKHLFAAITAAEAISKGDLTQRLEATTTDEVSLLCSSLNDMVANLREQVLRTLKGVDVLSSSTAEISGIAAQLSQTASQVASAVSETTAIADQVKQAARLASEKAKNVAQVSQRSVQTSESGRKSTQDTVSQMKLIKDQMESIGEAVARLSEQSQAIESIIGAVQDLADQSNLLAVNASIEAARAGDQGKGFSVVAHEIKTLAGQSKEATEQIRNILEDTHRWVRVVVMSTEQAGKAVDAGVEQSVLGGDSIQALASNVSQASQATSVIEESSQQQLAGLEQVVGAMSSIYQAVQQNLSGTIKLEEAAKQLDALGNQLSQIVRQYKV